MARAKRLFRAAFGAMAMVGALAGMGFVAAAQETGPAVSIVRVRAGDARAASLLQAGVAGSATFRRRIEEVEHSDLVVYVETRPMKLPGRLQLLAATPGCRHLRVSVRIPGLETDLVAWLGHELHHAVEIAGAPEVVDQAGLLRFYRRIGSGGRADHTVESAAAQETWTKVLCEMRAAR